MNIQMNKITKNFSGTPLFEDLTMTVGPAEKIGLVGQNGTGKTTLFQIILGEEGIDQGQLSKRKGLKIGWIAQKLEKSELPVFDYLIQSFTEIEAIQQQLRIYETKMTDPLENLDRLMRLYGDLQQKFEAVGGYEIEDRLAGILKGLGLEQHQQTLLTDLSGGERVRVELAKILVQESDVLLLDEPTNHLDLAGIQWLENYLKLTKKAYIVISHDRAFLDQVTQRIIEIEDGQLVEYPGNYSRYIALKRERDQLLAKNFELQQKEIQRLKRMIHRYRQWGNEGDNEAFFKKAKEIERRLEKLTLVKAPIIPKKRISGFEQASRSGNEVVIAQDIGQLMGEKLLFSESSFEIYRGERLAITGDNGSGKSTLIKLILGEIDLDEGRIKLGASLKIGYLPQKLIFEHPEQRLLTYVKNWIVDEQKARQTLAQYGFFKEDVLKRVQDLSGGEQVRLYLLGLFQAKINFLILDEPTNHLDIYMREEIERLLESFSGTILAVTHDRYFLEKNFDSKLLIADKRIQKIK